MDIQFELLEETVAEFRIHLDVSDYEEKFRNQIKQIRKSIQMPGFRQGQVPNSLVLKKHGSAVLYEVLANLTNEWMSEYMEDYKIDSYGNPHLTFLNEEQLDPKEPKDIDIEFKVVVFPRHEFDLPAIPPIITYEIEVTDEDVENEIKNLQVKFGSGAEAERADQVDKYYEILFHIRPVDALGNPLDLSLDLVKTFLDNIPEDQRNPEIPEHQYLELHARYRNWVITHINHLFFGKAKGDIIRTHWDELVTESGKNPFFDHTISEELIAIYRKFGFTFEILQIAVVTPHPLNKEFYTKAQAPSIESEEDLRKHVRKSLESQMPKLSSNKRLGAVINEMYKQKPFSPHSDFLFENFANDLVAKKGEDNKISRDYLEQQYSNLLSHLTRQYYMKALMNVVESQIDLTDANYRNFIKKEANQLVYGANEPTVEGNRTQDEIINMEPFDSEEDDGTDYQKKVVNYLIKSKEFDTTERKNQFIEEQIEAELFSNVLTTEKTPITFGELIRL